ncbi:MAG: hypothetical protein A2096_17900 [Spirochaetes bacterium GWF1_41_5]|nr:MAG: hypothetical protein A2096_17900 [Spirochaetes bacterium GWF1_41_5]HBE04563.1 hypothetical protein [Spirochaetia bacterium]
MRDLIIRKSTLSIAAQITAILFFILLALSPYVFEHKFLFNEILSLSGLIIFIMRGMIFFRRGEIIYNLMSLFFLYGVIVFYYSFLAQDNFIMYLRTGVIVYSMLVFYLAYYLPDLSGIFLRVFRPVLGLYTAAASVIKLPLFYFHQIITGIFTPFLIGKKFLKYSLPLIMLFNIILFFTYSKIISVMTAAFFLLLFTVRTYRAFKKSVIIFFIAFAVMFIALAPGLNLINSIGGIDAVLRSSPVLQIDGSITWRLVFWYQIFVNQFPRNLHGLGFGTKVFPHTNKISVPIWSRHEILPYVFGAHNSFIYIFARMGIVSIIILIMLYSAVFREYFNHKKYYLQNGRIRFFYSFFIITIYTTFNVVLESPTHASLFWFLLGLVARAAQQRKNEIGGNIKPSVNKSGLIDIIP